MKTQLETENVITARNVLERLESQLKTAHKKRETLAKQRRPLVWAVQTGDASARTDLDALTEEGRRLDQDISDLLLAREEAKDRLASAKQAALDAEADALLAQAREIATQCLEAAKDFDEHLTAAVAQLRTLEDCREKLARTGALDSRSQSNFLNRPSIEHALAASGLSAFIGHIGASIPTTLHEWTKQTLVLHRPNISLQTSTSGNGKEAA